MQAKIALESLLRAHPALATTAGVAATIQRIPFERLKASIAAEKLPFPKGYLLAQEKLAQVAGMATPNGVYEIKEGKETKRVSASEYKAYWQDRLTSYADATFFKRRLAADIDFAFVTLQNNKEMIASYKGADEEWVKEALREVRAKDKQLRNDLIRVLQTIVSLGSGKI